MGELEDGCLDKKIFDEGFKVGWGRRSLALNESLGSSAKFGDSRLDRGKVCFDENDGGS